MTVSFAHALRDPQLLGGPFTAPSFAAWHVIAKLISGEPLSASERALAKRCTGRSRLPKGEVRRLFLVIGRRGGKSRFLSALGVWAACLSTDWRSVLSAGETAVVMLIGADRAQARLLMRYALGLCEVPLIASQVTRRSEDRIEFRNGAALEVLTNDARLIRGRTAAALIADEAAFYRTDGEGASSDEEVWSAAIPALATVPGGGWAVLSSSPSRPRGLLHRRWRELSGNDGAEDVAWQAASKVMNPTLPDSVIRKAMAEDPIRAKSEFGAEWRQAGDDFAPADAIEAVTDFGVKERPYRPGIRYFGFIDGAGGTGRDSYCTAISHAEPDGTAVLDLVLERRPRFVPAQVTAEHAAVLRSYGIREVQGDHYSAGWIRDEAARHGLTYRPSRLTRSELYLGLLPALLAGRVRLLDSPRLRDQFGGLERRVHAGGRESVDHGASGSGAGGGHDDVANAVAGALMLAGARPGRPFKLAAPEVIRCFDDEYSSGDDLAFHPDDLDHSPILGILQ